MVAPVDLQDLVEEPEHVLEGVRQPPVVITEQVVAFSTAAAVPLPRRTRPTSGVIAALRAMYLSSPADPRPARRHHPPRCDAFLEDAAMEREMHRL